MKYSQFKTEDFVKDEYFQKWVLDPDAMTNNFWNHWMSKNPDKQEAIDHAKNLVCLMSQDEDKLSREDFDAMWQNIIERRDWDKQLRIKKSSSKTNWAFLLKAAAIFVGLIGITYVIYQTDMFRSTEELPVTIEPQITLELQDGTIKTVNENATGVITSSEGQKVVNQKKNVLVYDEGTGTTEKDQIYNQLTVPYGKKFQLVLSDGTHVFLNSGSRLRYPVKFLKNKPRDVFLDGEAFFTVAEDKVRPFTVITDEMNTQVYGTRFNVTSYNNEKNTSTVLVEGSVGVYRSNNDKGNPPIIIAPGQRAVFENNTIETEKVNVNKYVAWTEGKLFFVDDSFELILKELERHFNVQIHNELTKLNDKRFTGTFINESLEEILRICQEHSPFDYSKDGNIITIQPKTQ